MKTIRFVREQHTFNEYTCDQLSDCTGYYIDRDELTAELEMLLADSTSKGADKVLQQLLEDINK
jgi:hypothetical protein